MVLPIFTEALNLRIIEGCCSRHMMSTLKRLNLVALVVISMLINRREPFHPCRKWMGQENNLQAPLANCS
ncbi:hypothetical protein F0562_015050 [Nyssa sinensis]|uniref:Uncharacterized protein n=1 Tax=Nyssa sinensis TaxID=561372 RepID=A0A5J4ZSG7_9ASTE|nr:hypothetical protein F0562_015050 [Nyssa sinensis]